MYDDLKKILHNTRKEKIAVYGIGSESNKVIRDFSDDFDVCRIDLDSVIKQELQRKRLDGIILTEQMIAQRDVFDQLLEYSLNRNTPIYDVAGRDLSKICSEAMSVDYSDENEIVAAIMAHECVSFDIFDTLLMRKVMYPEDVFELMEDRLLEKGIIIRNFKDKRMKAQAELGLTNPDIYQIYKKLGKIYKISEQNLKICCDLEIQIESELLIPRNAMVSMFEKCKKLGKKVFLVSDMYIPQNSLEPILAEKNVAGYDGIYISCDKKQLKLQGLLERYKSENPAESYLHIGDHRIHDGICARLDGIDYCLIPSSLSMAQNTLLNHAIQRAETLEEHVMVGLVIAALMNNPFRIGWKKGQIDIFEDKEYGFLCAPLISKFIFWIYDQIKEEKYDDILFASRDGFLVQQLYHILCQNRSGEKMPEGRYFYTSRKAAVMTGINNEAFINMVIDISIGMKPRKIMTERFGIESKYILKYDVEKYGDSIHKYVWDHAESIFNRAEEAKQNYFKYMGKIGLQIGKRYAFMDFVSSGTCQKSLKRISPFAIEGLYTGWNGTDRKEDVRVRALFESSASYFMRHFKVMETFMTSSEPSLSHFDEDGNPVFMRQDRSIGELEFVNVMQSVCKVFFCQFIDITKKPQGNIKTEFVDLIFEACECTAIRDKNSILLNLTLMDNWRQKKNKVKELVQ